MATKSDADASSKRWRPCWLSKSSESTRSRRSSGRTSLSFTHSSTTSRSLSIRTATSEHQNVYQLHSDRINKPQQSLEEAVLELPNMRYDLDDEIFHFPTPNILAKPHQLMSQPKSPPNLAPSSRQQSDSRRSSKQTRCSDRSDSRTTSRSLATNIGKGGPGESTEIEMASREQYGYWRASLATRLPAVAALCGAVLLKTRLRSRSARDIKTSANERLEEEACAFCIALDECPTNEDALPLLHSQSVETLVCALKASLDAANISPVPTKLAVSIYEKIIESKERPHKREKLFPRVIKLLRKVPQDILVSLIFLLSIARRLHKHGITIDGQNPAIYLLSCLWPSSLALSPDPNAGDSASKLLALHFDEIPDDIPLTLEAVNCRFGTGKKHNILSLMAGKREVATFGTAGIKEILGAEDKHIQW